MTAGTNGTPENDDPFGYLYRPADGDSDAAGQEAVREQPGAPGAGRGVPRTSYNQATRVGQNRQRPAQPRYTRPEFAPGQQPPAQSRQETLGRAASRRGGQGGGPNTRGLLIGAIAVVAAVAIGISVAVILGDDGEQAGGNPSPTQGQTGQSSTTPSQSVTSDQKNGELPLADAAKMALAGGAKASTQWAGAKGAGGTYVDGMGTVGASVTWQVDVAKAGAYDFNVRYANAEKDPASATVTVNGAPLGWKLKMPRYAKEGDWTLWYRYYVTVNLTKGKNTIAVSCGEGDACHFNLDQFALGKNQEKPKGWG